ncbi:hypothetical protein O3M35_009164 [Rhynocoris fuscipes]|uniref:Uncharacterized protein n=1 Tax=Rhynocoris fuscipes TaxID=488301 RepID=A0AAW1D1Y7_9HEMI
MDVSLNNMLESTRQYFQGIPIGPGGGANGGGSNMAQQQQQSQQPQLHPQQQQQQQQQQHQQQQQQQVVSGGGTAGNGGTGGPGQYHRNQHIQQQQSHYWNASQPQSHHQHQVHHQQQTSQQTNTSSPSVSSYQSQHHHSQPTQSQQHSVSQSNNYYMHHQSHHSSQNVHHQNHNQQTHNLHPSQHNHHQSQSTADHQRVPLAPFSSLGYRSDINNAATGSGVNGPSSNTTLTPLKSTSSNHRLEYQQPPVYHQLNGSSQTQNSAHSHQTHQTQQQQQQQQHRSGFGPSPGYAPYSGPSYSPAQHVAVPQQPPTQQQQQQQLAQHQSHQQSHGHSEQDSRAKVSQHGQQFYQPSRPTPPSVPSPAAAPNINHHPLGPHGMKRESPLDLSVKTIRQSADSTADPPPSSGSDQLFYSFHSELLRNKASGSTPPVYHQMQQQQQQQSQHHHPQSRQQVQSHSVPSKIDYMNSANFTANNSHLQVQMEKKRRKELQYQYPLPPVNSFTSSNSTNVKQLDMKHYYPAARMQTLSQEIPKYGQQNNYLKRPAEPTEKLPQLQQPLPKLPRTNDSWRQTINQQIEKKFNSYLSSKALNGDVNSRAHNKGQFANCGNIIQANGISTADKRGVLSILRNSLETKDARNQIFQQQLQQQQQQHHHHQQQQHQQQQQQLHQHQQQQQHHHPHPHLQQQQQLHHHQQQLQLQQQQQQQYLSQQQQHHQHLQHKQKQQAASLHNHQQRYAAPSIVPSTPNLPPFEAIAMLERNSVPPYSRLQVPKAVDSIQEFNKFRVPPQQMLQEVVDISDEGEDVLPMQQLPASAPKGELDGLAAFLAARIRTKAELKQVGSNQPDSARSVTPASSTNSLHTSPRATPGFVSPVNNSKDLVKVSGGDTSSNSKCSPWVLNSPKVTKDVNLSRRRLFSRPDEEPGGGSNNNNNSNSNNNCQDSESTGVVMPPRNPNGLRSSSEASVFDFRDSESESEMPVLERQSLNEMRRVKSREGDLNQDDAEEEHKSWIELCDEFVMQLQFGKNPRKGRRRKGLMEQKTAATSASSIATATITSTTTTVSPTVTSDEVVDAATANVTTSTTASSVACITTALATMTTATVTTTIGTTLSSEAVTTLATSTTVEISSATPVEVIKEEKTVEPVEFASVKCSENNDNNIVKEACDIKKEIVSDNDNSVPAPPSVLELVNGIKKEEVKEEEKSDDSESEQDTKAPMTLRVRKPKVGPKPKVRKRRTVTPKKKKPTITNGCEFEPGWEEELYKYKKSLRMPSGLITISRPSNWPRPPLSLPDMEALPDSPMTADSADSVSPSNHALSKERTLTEEKHYLDRLMARYDARRLAYKERQQKLQKDADSKQQQKEAISSLPTPVSGSISLKSCSGGSDSFKKGSSTESKDDIIKGGSCTGEADLPLKAKSMLWPGKNSVATIREIFGVERPASAPPPGATKEEEELKKGRKKGKKLMVGKRNLLAKESITQNTIEGVTVGPKQVGEKRLKTIRRKLKSSGFDYIRKKKKTQNNSLAGSSKKESGIPGEDTPTRKRKKATPKTEAEIQAEIKSWVLNKGLGETILHRASRVGNYEVVKYCLDKLQHNPAPRDNAGYTPLHEASSKGNYAIASLLLSHGANPSDSALGGVRPLHQAAENGYYKLVKLLLEHGADPQLATYSGYTPLSLAADEEIKQLISLHITNCNTPPPSVTIKSEDGSPSETSQVCEKTDNEFHSKEIIDGFEIEESDVPLPHLYRLSNEPRTDSWVLFHELAPLLHVKTKEALLKQLGQEHQAVLRDMKLSDFFAKAHCRTLRATGASPKMQKVTLVKYTSAVKFLLGVETCVIPR